MRLGVGGGGDAAGQLARDGAPEEGANIAFKDNVNVIPLVVVTLFSVGL